VLLCKATYDKTKECLQKEKSRQVRKRKHEERAIRMGWKKADEPDEPENIDVDALMADLNAFSQ
jgi:hypothetical protein